MVDAGTEGVKIQYGRGGSIRGRLLNPDGTPAGDLWATATGSDGISGNQVGDDGTFSIPELPAGDYRFSVSSQIDGKNFHATVNAVVVRDGAPTDLGDLTLQPLPQ